MAVPAPLNFPALHGDPVTEAHARDCRDNGHAAHVVDGRPTGVCPRCGEVTERPRVSLVKVPTLPPSGADVEFINASDDTRTWRRGEFAFTSNTGMAYVRIPSKDSVVAHSVHICLPTDVRLYR